VQAFALPNGPVYISTGMLSALETEGQMALVLAREIAHVAGRHQYRKKRLARDKAIMQIAASPFGAGQLLMASLAWRWASGDGYGSVMENEADRDGLDATMAAGYDARSAARVFVLLDENLEFEPLASPYRRHDNLDRRVKSMRKLAGSVPASGRGGALESDYFSHVANAMCYSIGADLESRRARTALARAQRLVNWMPERAEYRVLLADAYRELGAKTSEPTKEELSFGGYDRRPLMRMTPEEEQAKLLAKRGGADVKKANETAAERLYPEAIARQPIPSRSPSWSWDALPVRIQE